LVPERAPGRKAASPGQAERAVRASYLVAGTRPEAVFAALLDVRSFPEWAVGLGRARALEGGQEASGLRPGTLLEFDLSAGGLSHRVVSAVTVVEPPRRIEWRYAEGATGGGGWLVERAGAGTVRMTLSTDYTIRPAWLDAIAHRPFFRGLTEDLLRRSMRRFAEYVRGG
jgi:uncharacterized protein YndB with AHSA1/START domain